MAGSKLWYKIPLCFGARPSDISQYQLRDSQLLYFKLTIAIIIMIYFLFVVALVAGANAHSEFGLLRKLRNQNINDNDDVTRG